MSSFACQKIKLLFSASPKTLSLGYNSSPVHTGWGFNITSCNVHPVQNIIRFGVSRLHKTQMVLKSNCSSVIEDPWHRNGNHVTNCYGQELLMQIGKITKCTNFVYTSQSVKLGYAWASSLEFKKKKKKDYLPSDKCKQCHWPHLGHWGKERQWIKWEIFQASNLRVPKASEAQHKNGHKWKFPYNGASGHGNLSKKNVKLDENRSRHCIYSYALI